MSNTSQDVSIYKALANAKRLAILHLLEKQELSVNLIAKNLGLTQPNVSQHLMLLRREKIVSYRKIGKNTCYYLNSSYTKFLLMISS